MSVMCTINRKGHTFGQLHKTRQSRSVKQDRCPSNWINSRGKIVVDMYVTVDTLLSANRLMVILSQNQNG